MKHRPGIVALAEWLINTPPSDAAPVLKKVEKLMAADAKKRREQQNKAVDSEPKKLERLANGNKRKG